MQNCQTQPSRLAPLPEGNMTTPFETSYKQRKWHGYVDGYKYHDGREYHGSRGKHGRTGDENYFGQHNYKLIPLIEAIKPQ